MRSLSRENEEKILGPSADRTRRNNFWILMGGGGMTGRRARSKTEMGESMMGYRNTKGGRSDDDPTTTHHLCRAANRTKHQQASTAQQQWRRLHRHHRPRRKRRTRRSLLHHHLVGNIISRVVENLPHQHHYLSPPWKMDHRQHLLMTNIIIREAE